MGAKSCRFQWGAGLLALGLFITACVDEADVDEELDAEEESGGDDEDIEPRNICFYFGPPASDDIDTLVGAATQVETYDTSDGACDLHMFQVAATPPSHRARTIEFQATTLFEPPDEYQARVWTKSCAHGCGEFVSQSVPLVVTGGDCMWIHGACIQRPWMVSGELALSASNVVYDIRAGMRVLTDDGDAAAVTIVVSE
jgi:hypothetical protein